MRQGRLPPRQGRRAAAGGLLDELGCFLPGFGELTGRSAVDPATTDWILANLKQKGVLLEVEKYPQLPALLAMQDGTALPAPEVFWKDLMLYISYYTCILSVATIMVLMVYSYLPF